MDIAVYVFSAPLKKEIEIGVRCNLWALPPVRRALRDSTSDRASRVHAGNYGLFYCEREAIFTSPFVFASAPDTSEKVNRIWAETREFGFELTPLGTPRRTLYEDDLIERVRLFGKDSQTLRQLTNAIMIPPFQAIHFNVDNWHYLLAFLGEWSCVSSMTNYGMTGGSAKELQLYGNENPGTP